MPAFTPVESGSADSPDSPGSPDSPDSADVSDSAVLCSEVSILLLLVEDRRVELRETEDPDCSSEVVGIAKIVGPVAVEASDLSDDDFVFVEDSTGFSTSSVILKYADDMDGFV